MNFSNSRNDRSRHGTTVQFHGSTPYGGTRIVIGGTHPSNQGNSRDGPADIGTFFQTVLGQMVGGQQFPL